MTRKDYIKIAEVIKNNSTSTGKICTGDFIKELCLVFGEDNPNFDSFTFMNACDPYSFTDDR
jgi:hypothetical protein|tara:strand:+ start:289 stop:474 length:186 start_codon:yes stop_codon:yes gene_type:complete